MRIFDISEIKTWPMTFAAYTAQPMTTKLIVISQEMIIDYINNNLGRINIQKYPVAVLREARGARPFL